MAASSMSEPPSSTTVVHLRRQYIGKLQELATIYQHVWDISRKISEMEDDPLPEQLKHSVPGFLRWLERHTEGLAARRWPFLVHADAPGLLHQFLVRYLSTDVLSHLPPICSKHFIYIGYHCRQYAKVMPYDTDSEPFIVQNWEGLASYLQGLEQDKAKEAASSVDAVDGINQNLSSSCHHIEIYLPIDVLKGGLQLVIPPSSEDIMDTDDLSSHLSDAHGLVYVMEHQQEQHLSDKLEMLLVKLLKDPTVNHHLLTLASCVVIANVSSTDSADEQKLSVIKSDLHSQVKRYLPSSRPSSVIATNLSTPLPSPLVEKETPAIPVAIVTTEPSLQCHIEAEVHVHENGERWRLPPESVKQKDSCFGDIVPDAKHQDSCLEDIVTDLNHQDSRFGCIVTDEQVDNVKNSELEGGVDVSGLDGVSLLEKNGLSCQVNVALQEILEASVMAKCHALYSWLYAFVGRVMHHLRAFLSQAEKSQDERIQTHTEILAQLTQLTDETSSFFASLRREVDHKAGEAVTLLRLHLMRDDVMTRLAVWSDDEAPNDDIWAEVDHDMREEISRRIRSELVAWEQTNQFFSNLRPCLIVHFEQRFVPIGTRLNEVETRIARHDSQLKISNTDTHGHEAAVIEAEHGTSWLPNSLTLKWQQKLLLGVAAPVLVPLAVTLAILGLPIIGGLMAKDLIVEKLADNKLREYNTDRVKYLRRRTVDEITKFCRTKALENYVKLELEPAYKCVEQLQKVVPCQIDANKAQIASLKNDVREAKDIVRFYQPLLEVFDHYKMLLMLYKVMHMRRERIDVEPGCLDVSPDNKWTSVGLKSSIKAGFLKTGDTKKLVSVKFFKVKLDIHNIEDYLQEESAYRFQASTFIAKFLGLCKLPRGEFTHILEPLKCSMRDYVRDHNVLGFENRCPAAAASPDEINDAAADHNVLIAIGKMSEERQRLMKKLMVEVVRGLDYLHERGWVHFDLNMDSVCMDFNNHVKLINISSRRMYRLPAELGHADIYKYTHLPHEVLMYPPSAYTHLSEMYCVGIMMWELWTRERAYYYEIGDPVNPLNTMDKFVAYVEQCRPRMDFFYLHPQGDDVRRPYINKFAEAWAARLQQCWSETDRLTSKAWLALMDDERSAATALPIREQHFATTNT